MNQRSHIDHDTLERLAANEGTYRRQQKRIMVILAITVALGVGGVLYAVHELGKAQPVKVAIDPAKLPPIRPGPPQ